MTKTNRQEWANGVRLLSVLLASLLWLSVVLERQGQVQLRVPVRPKHLPSGMCVVSPPPSTLNVTVSGPRILLCLLPFHEINCGLDLSDAQAGTASFAPVENMIGLNPELKVVRVTPGAVTLTLAKEEASK